MNKNLLIAAIIVGSLLVGSVLYRAIFWTFVDNYEFAYKFDAIGGEVSALKNSDGTPKQGYIFAWPLIERIHRIDTRPMQVCINANSRVLNCKLVHFDPEGFELFISWHGRGDYSGYQLEQILMSYAYDPSQVDYPFLKIKKELKNQDVVPETPLNTNKDAEKDDKQEDKE
jgi:hypothetical protein